MNAIEIYVLCESRSAELAEKFLDHFSPSRTPVAEDYPYPEYEDEPSDVFSTATELMRRLEVDQSESYSIYWNCSGNEKSEQVMLFYTEDGSLVAGLGGPVAEPFVAIQQLAHFVGGRFGYISSGSCPPETRKQFISLCRASTLDSLCDGNIRRSPLT